VGIEWFTLPEVAFTALANAYASDLHRGAVAVVLKWDPVIETWMKQNAPWTDRTGNARQTLHNELEQVINVMVELILAHGVDYGIHLETKFGGRYAIIGPALDHFIPLIWRDIQAMVRG
jgi:hypothetical protein